MTHGSLFSGIGGFDLAAVDSLANHTVTLGSEEARKMTVTSGQRCSELFARYNHVSSWAKTLLGCLVGTTEWYSTKLLLTWKMKDMRHKRFLFQLVPRMPHTEEIESGLLPTPILSDIHHTERVKALKETGAETMGSRKNGANRPNGLTDWMDFHGLLPTPMAVESIERRNMNTVIKIVETGSNQITLTTMAKYGGLLPTPMAQNRETTLERKDKYGGEKRAMYLENYAVMGLLPTPRVKGHGNSHQRIEEGKIDDLTTMAKRGMLPTPCMNDYKGSAGPSENWKGKSDLSVQIHELLKVERGKTSQLNPLFVAEMMGFPPNWTVLPFQNGETNQLRDTEMP
jgi:hypothetical protein